VLAFVVIVPVVALGYSLRQSKLYEASAQVLLKTDNIASSLLGIQTPTSQDTPDRQAQTQAGLARVPDVVKRVLAVTHATDISIVDFLNSSSVDALSNSNLLEFKVTASTATEAARLATAYAAQYTVYRKRLDTAAIDSAEKDVSSSLASLGPSSASSSLYSQLLKTREDLKTLAALQTSNAILVKSAGSATQVRPRPVRNAALGLVLGLLLGCGFAFLANALDTRVSDEEIADYYSSPLVGRLPKPSVRVRKSNRLVMLETPSSVEAEAYRLLSTNLDFLLLTNPATVLMVTSALDGEGKSPVAANLAIAAAQPGRTVRLIDLDLRRPMLATYFGMPPTLGLTDVAMGSVTLEQALALIPADSKVWRDDAWATGEVIVVPPGTPMLEILPAGKIPPNPSELVGSSAVHAIIATLRETSDLVIVDAPPLLAVADPLVISKSVDAIIVTARRTSLRRRTIKEASRLLGACPAPTIGHIFVDADVESTAYYRYGEQAQRGRKYVRAS
jgi:Mrp family chromosome partitioning ATPase